MLPRALLAQQAAPASLILLGSMGKCCVKINGEFWSSHGTATVKKRLKRDGNTERGFLAENILLKEAEQSLLLLPAQV